MLQANTTVPLSNFVLTCEALLHIAPDVVDKTKYVIDTKHNIDQYGSIWTNYDIIKQSQFSQ